MLDNYLFFYSLLLACNDDVLSWDEFIDALDKDPSILTQISKTVEDYQKKDSIFNSDEEGEKKKLSVSELYSMLVLRYHYPPEYVLDKMQMYEIRAVLNYEYYAHKDNWE